MYTQSPIIRIIVITSTARYFYSTSTRPAVSFKRVVLSTTARWTAKYTHEKRGVGRSICICITLLRSARNRRHCTCAHRVSHNTSYDAFWATVCKTVRPMLSDRCLSVCLVTLAYCGQTVGWIKMPLGTEVGLGPDHTVLDGDPSPDGMGPNFSAHCAGTVAHLSNC